MIWKWKYTLHENNQRINSCRVCECASFFLLLLFLLLFENIPIFFLGFDDGISALFKYCALLWFMTYLFTFCSAYLSFGTFHFSRCQEKNNSNNKTEMKSKETFGVKCDFVYNLTDKGILCVCFC